MVPDPDDGRAALRKTASITTIIVSRGKIGEWLCALRTGGLQKVSIWIGSNIATSTEGPSRRRSMSLIMGGNLVRICYPWCLRYSVMRSGSRKIKGGDLPEFEGR